MKLALALKAYPHQTVEQLLRRGIIKSDAGDSDGEDAGGDGDEDNMEKGDVGLPGSRGVDAPRGGQVIQHTSTGKPVYAGDGESVSSMGYDFSPHEHNEAADAHDREHHRHQAVLSGLLQGMAKKGQDYSDRPSSVDHHGKRARLHHFYSSAHRVMGQQSGQVSGPEMQSVGMAKAEHELADDCGACLVMRKAAELAALDRPVILRRSAKPRPFNFGTRASL